MQTYIIQRILLAIPTLFGLVLAVFLGLRLLMPSDAVDQIMGQLKGQDPKLEAQLREDLGLSASVPVQFARYFGGLLRGDFGESLYTKKSIMQEFRYRVPVSFEIGLFAVACTLFISLPLGVISAVRQDKGADYILRSFAIIMDAMPGFWIAILALTASSLWFGWAPPITFSQLSDNPVEHFKIMLIPGILIGLNASGNLIRLVRVQMLEVLRQDYVRTARAKGLSERVVLFRHGLRNCMIPIVTVVGMSLPGMIGGTVIFEQIFMIPGMGRYLLESARNLDYPVIQSTNLIFASILVFSNIIVDVSYAYFDPRIRYA